MTLLPLLKYPHGRASADMLTSIKPILCVFIQRNVRNNHMKYMKTNTSASGVALTV